MEAVVELLHGAGRRLDTAWHAVATDGVARLRREASDARRAHARLQQADHHRAEAGWCSPTGARRGRRASVETLAAVAAWRRFQALPDGAVDIADHLERTHPPLREAVAAVRSAASAELDRRNAEWVPIAREQAHQPGSGCLTRQSFSVVRTVHSHRRAALAM